MNIGLLSHFYLITWKNFSHYWLLVLNTVLINTTTIQETNFSFLIWIVLIIWLWGVSFLLFTDLISWSAAPGNKEYEWKYNHQNVHCVQPRFVVRLIHQWWHQWCLYYVWFIYYTNFLCYLNKILSLLQLCIIYCL